MKPNRTVRVKAFVIPDADGNIKAIAYPNGPGDVLGLSYYGQKAVKATITYKLKDTKPNAK